MDRSLEVSWLSITKKFIYRCQKFHTSSKRTGTDFSAAKHQSTSQLTLDRPGYSPTERTGPDFSAVKHIGQPASSKERDH